MKDAASAGRDLIRASKELTAQAIQLVESAKQKEAAIRQGKQLEVSTHQEMVQTKQDDLKRTILVKQQELKVLRGNMEKIEGDIKTQDIEKTLLGKAPKGKETLADAKSFLGTLKSLVLNLEAAQARAPASCQEDVKATVGPLASALRNIDLDGGPIKTAKNKEGTSKKKPGNP
jgi:hypothetical protein